MKGTNYWIDKLGLQPHPEGGYFKEVYRSQDTVIHPLNAKSRNLAVSICFLLSGDDISHFHALDSDELWYFHEGAGANIHVLMRENTQPADLEKKRIKLNLRDCLKPKF